MSDAKVLGDISRSSNSCDLYRAMSSLMRGILSSVSFNKHNGGETSEILTFKMFQLKFIRITLFICNLHEHNFIRHLTRSMLLFLDQPVGWGGVQATAEPATPSGDKCASNGAAWGGTWSAQAAHQQIGEQIGTAEGLWWSEARN